MKLHRFLLNLFFPPRCVFCHELLPLREENGICPHCEKTLPRFHGTEKTEFVERVVAPFRYEAAVRDSLRRYKFGGRSFYASVYAPCMAEALRENPIAFDVISWVPLHPRRRRSRGYDQAELLARALSAELGAEAVPLLRKQRNAAPQSGTGDAAARRANISGCYAILPDAAAEGRRVLLVDDIFTTGATLSECARTLLMAGCEEVSAVTVATAHR